jgi:hypothetical protein
MSWIWIVPGAIGGAKAAEPEAPSLGGSDEEEESSPTPESELERRISDLEAQVKELQKPAASALTLNGYVDFGFFVPYGNSGIGWVRDVGNHYFPQYTNYAWTFYGDILSTAVNSRGEVASLGNAPGILRFDSINSKGAPGFIVNEVNQRLQYQLTKQAVLRTSINFVPRSGDNFSLGDFFDLDIAEMEYVLTDDGNTSIFVGKMLPVFGIEYRERKSDQRFGITPSLMQRYTSGTQLGLKVRSKLLSDWLIIAASVTNESSTTEQFHFYTEIAQNAGKIANGRVALNVPIDKLLSFLLGDTLEIGFSGEWGPQDRATDLSGKIWFWGVDLWYQSANFALKAQYMRGGAPGRADENVWGLDLKNGGYVEINWMVLSFLGAYARGSLRDAIVTLGDQRIYITKAWQATGGLRLVLDPHITLKAEYVHNGDYGGVPHFDHDIATSSLVLSY